MPAPGPRPFAPLARVGFVLWGRRSPGEWFIIKRFRDYQVAVAEMERLKGSAIEHRIIIDGRRPSNEKAN